MSENIESVNGGAPIFQNDVFTIKGSGFGAPVGFVGLRYPVGTFACAVNSWTDTEIEAVAPATIPGGTTAVCFVTAFGNPQPDFDQIDAKENVGGFSYSAVVNDAVDTQLDIDDSNVPNTAPFSSYPARILFVQNSISSFVVCNSSTKIKFPGLNAVALRRGDGSVLQDSDLTNSFRVFTAIRESTPGGISYRVTDVVNSVETLTVSGAIQNLGNDSNPDLYVPPQTTAGIISESFFTGDEFTSTTPKTFYLASSTTEGAVASASEVVVVDDGEKLFFGQDILGSVQTESVTTPKGFFAGKLSVQSSNSTSTVQFGVEVYRADSQGVPLASGVPGAVVGDLGVTIVGSLDSIETTTGLGEKLIDITGVLTADVTLLAGQRYLVHVYGKKVSTAGGPISLALFVGSNHSSYILTPIFGAGSGSGVQSISITDGEVNDTDPQNPVISPDLQRYGVNRDGVTNTWLFNSPPVYTVVLPKAMVIVSSNWTGLSASTVISNGTASYPLKTEDGFALSSGQLSNNRPYVVLVSFPAGPSSAEYRVQTVSSGVVGTKTFDAVLNNNAVSVVGSTCYMYRNGINTDNSPVTASANATGIANSVIVGLGPLTGGKISSVNIKAPKMAVSQGTVGAAPVVDVVFYRMTGTGWVSFGGATVPVVAADISKVMVNNNASGTDMINAKVSGLNVVIPDDVIWGAIISPSSATNNNINLIGKVTMTISGVIS